MKINSVNSYYNSQNRSNTNFGMAIKFTPKGEFYKKATLKAYEDLFDNGKYPKASIVENGVKKQVEMTRDMFKGMIQKLDDTISASRNDDFDITVHAKGLLKPKFIISRSDKAIPTDSEITSEILVNDISALTKNLEKLRNL